MTPWTLYAVVVAGLLGLVVGSFLNVVAYRVPAHISLTRESRCPRCDTAIPPWQNVPVVSWLALGGRCAACGAPISPRYPLVEAITGVAFAVVTWGTITRGADSAAAPSTDTWALTAVTAAYLYFAAISIVLTLIDLDTHRLPNSIVLPSYVVAGILFAVAALAGGDASALLRAGVGMVVLYTFYALLRAIRPGGMGGGDVKLAGVIGIHLGWIGWGALAVGSFAAFLLGGVFGIGLLLAHRAGRKTAIPFGPWMILGAWLGIIVGQPVGQWYVNLFIGA